MISTFWNQRSVIRISICILLLTGGGDAVLSMLLISLHEFFIVAFTFALFHTFYFYNCE